MQNFTQKKNPLLWMLQMNLETELIGFGERFGIPEKKLLTWWRSNIRSMWTNSQAYLDFMESGSVMVENTGRNAKRYPMVKRHQCAICKNWFGTGNIEIDHLDSENQLTSFSDVNIFTKSILFTSPERLQKVCSDRYKTVNKKKVLVDYGCHSLKTFLERFGKGYGINSLEQAKIVKQVIELDKTNSCGTILKELGITEIGSTKEKRKLQLIQILLNRQEKEF